MYERREEGFKFSERLSAEAAKLTKLSEDRLYEMIGEALYAQELLKEPTKFLQSEGSRRYYPKQERRNRGKKGRYLSTE